MIKVLVCTALVSVSPIDWPAHETCEVAETTRTVETFCAWTGALTEARGRRVVTFCRPFDGRLKP